MSNTLEDKDWDLLLRRIKAGKCTPFLGAGAAYGVLPLMAAILMIARRLRRGLILGYWGLLFILTAVHLLMFYFNQFNIIATTLLQFSLLFGIVRYRTRYLDS